MRRRRHCGTAVVCCSLNFWAYASPMHSHACAHRRLVLAVPVLLDALAELCDVSRETSFCMPHLVFTSRQVMRLAAPRLTMPPAHAHGAVCVANTSQGPGGETPETFAGPVLPDAGSSKYAKKVKHKTGRVLRAAMCESLERMRTAICPLLPRHPLTACLLDHSFGCIRTCHRHALHVGSQRSQLLLHSGIAPVDEVEAMHLRPPLGSKASQHKGGPAA